MKKVVPGFWRRDFRSTLLFLNPVGMGIDGFGEKLRVSERCSKWVGAKYGLAFEFDVTKVVNLFMFLGGQNGTGKYA